MNIYRALTRAANGFKVRRVAWENKNCFLTTIEPTGTNSEPFPISKYTLSDGHGTIRYVPTDDDKDSDDWVPFND